MCLSCVSLLEYCLEPLWKPFREWPTYLANQFGILGVCYIILSEVSMKPVTEIQISVVQRDKNINYLNCLRCARGILTLPCASILKSFNLPQKEMNFRWTQIDWMSQWQKKNLLYLNNLKVASLSATGHITLFLELKYIRCCILYSVTVFIRFCAQLLRMIPRITRRKIINLQEYFLYGYKGSQYCLSTKLTWKQQYPYPLSSEPKCHSVEHLGSSSFFF